MRLTVEILNRWHVSGIINSRTHDYWLAKIASQ